MKADIVVGKDYFQELLNSHIFKEFDENIYLSKLREKNFLYTIEYFDEIEKNFKETEYHDLYLRLVDKMININLYGESVNVDRSSIISANTQYDNEILLLLTESRDKILISDLNQGIESIIPTLNINRVTLQEFEMNLLSDYELPKPYLINIDDNIDVHLDFIKKYFVDAKEIEIRDGHAAKDEGKDVLINEILKILPSGIDMKILVLTCKTDNKEAQALKDSILNSGKVNKVEIYGSTKRVLHDREILILNKTRKDAVYSIKIGRGLSIFTNSPSRKAKYRGNLTFTKESSPIQPLLVNRTY